MTRLSNPSRPATWTSVTTSTPTWCFPVERVCRHWRMHYQGDDDLGAVHHEDHSSGTPRAQNLCQRLYFSSMSIFQQMWTSKGENDKSGSTLEHRNFNVLRDVLIRIKNSCAQCQLFHVLFFARDVFFLYWSSFDCTYWLPIVLCDMCLFYQAWHSVHAMTFSSIGAGLIA